MHRMFTCYSLRIRLVVAVEPARSQQRRSSVQRRVCCGPHATLSRLIGIPSRLVIRYSCSASRLTARHGVHGEEAGSEPPRLDVWRVYKVTRERLHRLSVSRLLGGAVHVRSAFPDGDATRVATGAVEEQQRTHEAWAAPIELTCL